MMNEINLTDQGESTGISPMCYCCGGVIEDSTPYAWIVLKNLSLSIMLHYKCFSECYANAQSK